MRRSVVPVVVLGGLLAAAPPALAMPMGGEDGTMVSIVATSFAPEKSDVLAGDTVMWQNDSVLQHTVTATDGGFGSQRLFGGDTFSHRFGTAGAYEYYCTVHPYMHGEVDVHRVLLDAPGEPGSPRAPYTLSGRAALPEGSTVAIERDAGTGFVPAGTATVDSAGAFAASVRSKVTASYRAVAGGDTSPAVRLLIVDRRITARAARGVVTARVTPASPRATVVLQLRLRNRFGWWPAARHRLDRGSRTSFVVHAAGRSHVSARVVLTLSDGATALARSHAVRVSVRPGRPAPGARRPLPGRP